MRGKFKSSKSGVLLRKGLVVIQFTASIALIGATFVVQNQVDYMISMDKGIKTDHIVGVNNPSVTDDQVDEKRRKMKIMRDELRQHPAVLSVAATSSIPGGNSSDISSSSGLIKVVGVTEPVEGTTYIQFIDENFIKTLGLELLVGRNFNRDIQSDSSAVIVNEALLRKLNLHDPNEVLLEYLQQGSDDENEKLTIIGVINDFNRTSLKHNVEPTLYFYYPHLGTSILELDKRNFKAGMEHLETMWTKFFPDHPLEFSFLDQRFDQLFKEDRLFGNVVSIFSVLALIVALLGLFALSSYTAIQRTKEVGVRKVLGASVFKITIMFLREFILLSLIAAVFGIPIVYLAMNTWLDNYAFRIDFPWFWMLLSLVMVSAFSLLSVSLQIIRVAKVNPVDTLRHE